MIYRYRRWFEYEKDSHAKTLAALDAIRKNYEIRKASAGPST
jgi:hypothetical protein